MIPNAEIHHAIFSGSGAPSDTRPAKLLATASGWGRVLALIDGGRGLSGRLRERDPKLLGNVARDVDDAVARLIVVEKDLLAHHGLQSLLRGDLVDCPLKFLQQRLHQLASLLLHLPLALAGELLELLLSLLKLPLSLRPRRIVQQGLLLLKLLDLFLECLTLLLELALLLLHLLLHLLLNVLHPGHACQESLLIDVPNLLGLGRTNCHRSGKEKEWKSVQYSF
jgi:hypothetical protein